jgi:hypothetical protein
MISKNRTEMDGLASREVLPGYMIGGAEENHETLQLTQAVSGPKFETRPTQLHRATLCCQVATYGGQTGSRIVTVTSLAAASDEAS